MARVPLISQHALLEWLRNHGPQTVATLQHAFDATQKAVQHPLRRLRDSKSVFVSGFLPPAVPGRWTPVYSASVTGTEADAVEPKRVAPGRAPIDVPPPPVLRTIFRPLADEDTRDPLPQVIVQAKGMRRDHVERAQRHVLSGTPWAGL